MTNWAVSLALRGWALGLAWLLSSSAAFAAPDYHFRSPPDSAAVALNSRVLSADERAFLAALPEIRVAIPAPQTPPYELIAPDGEVSGIHPEMLVALARTFGFRIRPIVLPDWTRTLAALKHREADMVMTLGVTADRMEFLAFTLGATPLPGALFARKGATVDPAACHYALERNYLAHDWVRRQYPSARITVVESSTEALRAVAQGDVDCYLGSLLEAGEIIASQGLTRIEVNRMLNYGTGYYHFGIRKDWAPLAGILNKGIQTLRQSAHAEINALVGRGAASATLPAALVLDEAQSDLLTRQTVWRIGAVRGLALLNDIDENNRHSGVAAEYAEQVARRLGVATLPVAYDNVAAMLDGLRRGEIDLVPFLTRTPARQREFNFSSPYLELPYVIVSRVDDTLYWNLESLRGRRLALAAQHPLIDLLARDYPDIRIVEARNGNDAMDRVELGEAEAAVEVKLFANLRLHGDGGNHLRQVATVDELPAQFHFATTHDKAPILGLVDKALADIDAAERHRMLRRWVAVDLQPSFPWRRYLPLIGVSLAALMTLVLGTAWWMRRLNREVRARRHSEALLHDIAATVPGLMFRFKLDAEGRPRQVYMTPGAERLLGLPLGPGESLFALLSPRLDPQRREAIEAARQEALASGQPYRQSFAYRHPDGRERWLMAEAVRSNQPGGAAVWTGYLVDASVERSLHDRLARESEERQLLLASASHELRAPAHTLSLALEAVPDTGLNEAQASALHIARQSTHTLTELLNDVLEAARSGVEPLRARPRTFALRAFIDDLAGIWRVAAQRKGLDFVYQVEPGLPETISLDPLRLKQVLNNLLSNACKYTVQGEVVFRVRALPDGALSFEVDDTGIGIDAQALALLFTPYVTLDDPQAGVLPEGSTGLGLAMSRRVAALMNGHVSIDSSPGQGTRAALVVPLPATPPRSTAPVVGPILVCEDDATSRLLISQILRRQGFQVLEAATAAEALALWRGHELSALVTDMNLPDQTGQDLIAQVRDGDALRHRRTRVVLCSGSLPPVQDNAEPAATHDAFLVKPIESETLLRTLEQLGVAP